MPDLTNQGPYLLSITTVTAILLNRCLTLSTNSLIIDMRVLDPRFVTFPV